MPHYKGCGFRDVAETALGMLADGQDDGRMPYRTSVLPRLEVIRCNSVPVAVDERRSRALIFAVTARGEPAELAHADPSRMQVSSISAMQVSSISAMMDARLQDLHGAKSIGSNDDFIVQDVPATTSPPLVRPCGLEVARWLRPNRRRES